MSLTVGIDLGEHTIRIALPEDGIVLREPNIAAVDGEGYVVAVGTEALLTEGRSPAAVTLRRPIHKNRVTDFALLAETLDAFLGKTVRGKIRRALVTVKQSVRGDDREQIAAALYDCYVNQTDFLTAPHAVGVQTDLSNGLIVCDIGHSGIEVSYLRDHELYRSDLYPAGGREADRNLNLFLHRKYGLSAPGRAITDAKRALSLLSCDPSSVYPISGVYTMTGLPKTVGLSAEDLLSCLSPMIDGTVQAIENTLSTLPRQGNAAATADQILLVGAGAEIPGLADRVSEMIGRSVEVAEEPADAMIRGVYSQIITR